MSSGMPQMGAAFAGWTSRISLTKLCESVTTGTQGAGIVTTQQSIIVFNGTIQPLSPREIELKPEGQRSFSWLQIHCLSQTPILYPHDRISYKGRNYKVMGQYDYSLNGFYEYHCVSDYQSQGGC